MIRRIVMPRRERVISLVLLLVGMVSAAWADSNVRIVRLSFVEGDVQIDRRDDQGFNHAFLNMPVVDQARVWTRNDARAEVEFEDGSTARLGPDTIVEFRDL